jgi:hypothetical protein
MAAVHAAAVVVAAFEREGGYRIEGTTVMPWPHRTRGVTCRDGGLCHNDQRLREAGLVIGFKAHGSGGAVVRRTLRSLPTV